MEIRQARPEDLADAGRVTQAAWQEFARPGDPVWSEYFERLGDAAGRAERALVLVAVEGKGVVGTATVELERSIDDGTRLPAGQASFRMLAVAPVWRRRGIGTRLVEACLAEAVAAGKTVATLHTTPEMHAAAAIYRFLGFVRDESSDFTVAPGIVLLGYRRSLP